MVNRDAVDHHLSPLIVAILDHQPGELAPHPLVGAMWLASRGFPLECLVPKDGPAETRETPLGTLKLEGYGANSQIATQLRLLARVVSKRLKSRGGTVFYVHNSPICPAAWLGLLGVPPRRVIYHTQNFLEPGRHRHWEFFEKRMARRAGHVICNDPSRARFMASHYGLRAVPEVVRTGLPAAWPIPPFDPMLRTLLLDRLGLSGVDQARIVFHAGPFSSVRCSQEVIAALALLPPRYGLVFTGAAPGSPAAEAGAAAVRAAGTEGRAVFVEPLPFQQLLEHMAASDVGLLLYPNDGVGNFFQAPGRLTEYVSCGLPVVASAFPGLESVVLKHHLGAACDSASPIDIAAAIQQVCARSPAEVAGERERLRKLAKNDLSFDRDAPRLERIVRSARGGSDGVDDSPNAR
jgi:glycosyltransferase involved in cell wall biosynthesis